MYYRILFIVLSLLCNTSLYSVLVVAEKLDIDNFEGQPKTFYLYGDHHISDPETTKGQIAALQYRFVRREEKEEEVLHVLVEQSSDLVRDFYDSPMMLLDIIPALTKNTKLTKTVVEDVEIRCVGYASAAVLQPSIDPFEISNPCYLNAGDKWCTVNHITFQDLFNEYEEYRSKIEICQVNSSSVIQGIITEKLNDLDKEHRDLLEILKKRGISSDEGIWNLSCRLFQNRADDFRKQLYDSIFYLFLHLFDLACLKRMIELKEKPKIALIAGSWHVWAVNIMLLTAGARIVTLRGKFPRTECLYEPLGGKCLDLFFHSYFNCSIM